VVEQFSRGSGIRAMPRERKFPFEMFAIDQNPAHRTRVDWQTVPWLRNLDLWTGRTGSLIGICKLIEPPRPLQARCAQRLRHSTRSTMACCESASPRRPRRPLHGGGRSRASQAEAVQGRLFCGSAGASVSGSNYGRSFHRTNALSNHPQAAFNCSRKALT